MKTKKERINETFEIYGRKLRGGEFIDLYNRIVRDDGICGTIKETIDKNSHFCVAVKTNEKVL